MTPRFSYIVIASTFLWACGDSPKDPGMPVGSNAAAMPPGAIANSPSGYEQKSFSLCPALESYREELVAIVGFEHDPERALAMSTSSRKCFIRGEDGDFIGVQMPPAVIDSVKRHATESFDGTASPAPELGGDAMYVADISQPRVIFSMGPILIDVHATHSAKTPDRETMVALAARVRDILAEAN